MKQDNLPKIISLEELFDTTSCKSYYQVIINYDAPPDLTLGLCEVKQ